MIVKEAKRAAMTNRTPPSTRPLASSAGAFPRKSSAIAVLPAERPVAATLQHDHPPATVTRPAAKRARDAGFEPAPERAQDHVEERDEREQEEQLAGPDHPGPYSARGTSDQRLSGAAARVSSLQVREAESTSSSGSDWRCSSRRSVGSPAGASSGSRTSCRCPSPGSERRARGSRPASARSRR